MTLFAYRGDEQTDNFASAFSNSRFGNQAKKPDEDRQAIAGINSQSIWMVPFQQTTQKQSEPAAAISDSASSYSQAPNAGEQRVIDLDRQFARISNKSVKSARSEGSDSSNGSSLTEEIFGSIPNNFDQDDLKMEKQEKSGDTTQDSSEANNQGDGVQALVASLTAEEQ